MASSPYNFVLDSQPRFGLTQSEYLNLYSFLINFMKNVAKCSAFVSLSYQVHVKVLDPIPLMFVKISTVNIINNTDIFVGNM